MTVKVVENPRKLGLGKKSLYKCFGQTSFFSSKLIILKMTKDGASLMMESCSGQRTLYLPLCPP